MSADYDPTETTEKTPLIPGGGGDDDDDDNEWRNFDMSLHPIPEENKEQWQFPSDTDPNTTNPFEPGASSTPSGGENIPMTTRLPPEKQGASGGGGTAETSFTERITTTDAAARQEIKDDFPKMSRTELEFRYKTAPRSGGAIIEVRYHNKDTWYPLLTKSRGDVEKTLNTSLSKEIKDALGP